MQSHKCRQRTLKKRLRTQLRIPAVTLTGCIILKKLIESLNLHLFTCKSQRTELKWLLSLNLLSHPEISSLFFQGGGLIKSYLKSRLKTPWPCIVVKQLPQICSVSSWPEMSNLGQMSMFPVVGITRKHYLLEYKSEL